MFLSLPGVFTIITTALLSMPEFGLTHIATNLDHWFTWAFPMFALGDGLKVFYRNQQYKGVCQTPDIQMLCRVPAVMMPCCRGECRQVPGLPGPLFTKRTDVLPQDLVKSRSHEIRVEIFPIALQFDRQQCCRHACKISERYDNCNIQSRVFETWRDLAVRRLTA